jgi:hypothetical protein
MAIIVEQLNCIVIQSTNYHEQYINQCPVKTRIHPFKMEICEVWLLVWGWDLVKTSTATAAPRPTPPFVTDFLRNDSQPTSQCADIE